MSKLGLQSYKSLNFQLDLNRCIIRNVVDEQLCVWTEDRNIPGLNSGSADHDVISSWKEIAYEE